MPKHQPNIDSRDLGMLVPEFRTKVDETLSKCAERGVMMKPFFTLRGPLVQAKLWCQSRIRAEMALRVGELRGKGAPAMAQCLQPIWCVGKPTITNALPGNSWHQWGEAVDCVLLLDGKAEWDGRSPGYAVYAEEAEKVGLTSGFNWKSVDSVHLQLRPEGAVSSVFGWPEIDRKMLEMYNLSSVLH